MTTEAWQPDIAPAADAALPNRPPSPPDDFFWLTTRTKWVVPSNTTLGILLAAVNAIDRPGSPVRHLPRHRAEPAGPRQCRYLLWMLMGYLW